MRCLLLLIMVTPALAVDYSGFYGPYVDPTLLSQVEKDYRLDYGSYPVDASYDCVYGPIWQLPSANGYYYRMALVYKTACPTMSVMFMLLPGSENWQHSDFYGEADLTNNVAIGDILVTQTARLVDLVYYTDNLIYDKLEFSNFTYSLYTVDSDSDGYADIQDRDIDNDGWANWIEDATGSYKYSSADMPVDVNNDGIADELNANPDQPSASVNGFGEFYDDGNGVEIENISSITTFSHAGVTVTIIPDPNNVADYNVDTSGSPVDPNYYNPTAPGNLETDFGTLDVDGNKEKMNFDSGLIDSLKNNVAPSDQKFQKFNLQLPYGPSHKIDIDFDMMPDLETVAGVELDTLRKNCRLLLKLVISVFFILKVWHTVAGW